jgi:alpha-tubulin suppressor-like RCC1 family protein
VRPGQHYEGFEFVHDLWTSRVHPESFVEDADPSRGKKPKKVAAQPNAPVDADDADGGERKESDSDEDDDGSDDGSDSDTSSVAGAVGVAVDARKFGKSPFEGTVCGDTATLWGRRVAQCGSGASAAFACNDRGELFCWGGRDAWWREINAEDGADAVVVDGDETKEDDPILGGGMTERSQLLLNVRGKMAWAVEEEAKEQKALDDNHEQRPDDILADTLKAVCQYFDEWEPAPTNDTRLQHLQNVLLPCVEFEALRLSVDLRGQSSDNKNKQDLVDILFECLEIEEMAMPEGGSSRLRKMELDYAECKKRGRSRMAAKIAQELKETWAPLEQKRVALGEERRVRTVAAQEATHTKVEEGYRRWRAVQQAADEEGDPGGALALAPARNRKGRPKKGAKGSGRRGQGGKAASGAGGELALVDEAGAELVTPGSSSRGGGQSTGGSSRRQGKKRAVIQPIGVTARGPGPHIIPKSGRCRVIGVGGYHAAAVHTSGDLYVWGCGNYGRLGLGSTDNPDGYTRSSKGAPTKCETIASVEDVACGFSHSALVTTDQRLYVWGAGTTGKLGLGPITEQFECYCPEPTLLTIPGGRKVRMASCGHAHTAVVCMSGELYVWGSGDGGRLGLGKDRTGTFLEPVLVENLRNLGIRMWDVACGKAHTLAATRVREVFRGEGEHRVRVMDGGKVFQAGTAMAVGSYTPAFAPVVRLADQAVKSISAGDTHSGCVTVDGELFTWGSNAFGACGHPIVQEFIPTPTVVSCLYVLSKSLAIGKMVRQSSVYNKRGPTVVNNGVEIGDGENFCCHTQLDQQAWWDVDLGGLAVIDTITIHNREDSPADSSLGDDHFSKRLFPVWAILSVEPFTDEVGGQSLNDAFAVGTAMKKFTKNRRKIIWELPSNSIGRYVRIQLEGVNYLHIAEVGVFGCWGTHKNVGRVGRVSCGAGVTLATIEALKREADLEQAYVRAIKCDPFCALVLRQYHSFFEAYRVWGEGGDDLIDTCPLCRGGTVCEICQFHNMWPMKDKLPSGPGGRLRRFDSIARLCEEEPPPPLDFVAAVLPDRSWAAWFRKKLKLVWSVLSGKQRKQKKLDELRRRQEKALAAAKEDESDEVPFDDNDSDSTSSDED